MTWQRQIRDSCTKSARGCPGFELVQDEETMAEFNELLCLTFRVAEQDKSTHQSFLWRVTQTTPPLMHHWIVRKETQVVSTLTTLIEGDLVSFWNGATLPEERKKGLSTVLRHFALKNARAHGCTLSASYLMSGGMALGICTKLGFQSKWRFQAFLSP
jgi:GNAT superfamily N-acetyltransferase